MKPAAVPGKPAGGETHVAEGEAEVEVEVAVEVEVEPKGEEEVTMSRVLEDAAEESAMQRFSMKKCANEDNPRTASW